MPTKTTKEKNDKSNHTSSAFHTPKKEAPLGSNTKCPAHSDTTTLLLSDAQQWTNRYGALILFFEQWGHTNVPIYHKNQNLYHWVTIQRGRFAELSQQQIKQLRIFNFDFPGHFFLPVHVRRCSHETCSKFAAFNGFCHEHFAITKPTISTSTSSAPTNNNKTKTPKQTKTPKLDFPLVGLRKRKNGNYDIESIKEKVKDIPRNEVINKLNIFLQKTSHTNCTGPRGPTVCTCMKFLSDKPFIVESVSHAIMDYYDLTSLQRKHYAVERLRYAGMGKQQQRKGDSQSVNKNKGPQRIFSLPLSYEYFEENHLPGVVEEEEEEEEEDVSGDHGNKQEVIGQAFKHSICSHAFHNIHHIGGSLRQTLNKYANGDLSVGQHGNAGKKWGCGKKYMEAYESLRDSLNMLMEEYREYGNHNHHNSIDNDDVILPLQLSQRKWFERWTRERGWNTKKVNASTGQYEGAENWDIVPGFYRTEEEAIENGGDVRNVAKIAISWTVFNKFWNTEFPQLKTQGRVGKGMFGGKYDFEKKKYYTKKI